MPVQSLFESTCRFLSRRQLPAHNRRTCGGGGSSATDRIGGLALQSETNRRRTVEARIRSLLLKFRSARRSRDPALQPFAALRDLPYTLKALPFEGMQGIFSFWNGKSGKRRRLKPRREFLPRHIQEDISREQRCQAHYLASMHGTVGLQAGTLPFPTSPEFDRAPRRFTARRGSRSRIVAELLLPLPSQT